MRGQHLVRSSGPWAGGGWEVPNEQEFREAEEATEAEAAEDPQGATQRKARREEARVRLVSPGRQVEDFELDGRLRGCRRPRDLVRVRRRCGYGASPRERVRARRAGPSFESVADGLR